MFSGTHKIKWFVLVPTILILFSFQSHAAIDGIQSALADRFAHPLRWDNIEAGPEWISGPKPKLDYKKKCHLIRLEPGKAVFIHLKSYAILRILSHTNDFHMKRLDVSISNGSGLYVYPAFQVSDNGRSVLLDPESEVPLLVRIALPLRYSEAIELSLYTSRQETLNNIIRYRHFVNLPLDLVWLREGKLLNYLPYFMLNADTPVDFRISGPCRLAIENRLIYVADLYQRIQPYRIFASIDGKPDSILECTAIPSLDNPVYDSGHPTPVGRTETVYINIPEGDHQVTLSSSDDVYLRLLAHIPPDLHGLSRQFNEPEYRLEQQPPTLFQENKETTLWNFTSEDINRMLSEKSCCPDILEKIAMRIVRDNQRQDGGLVGSMMFLNLSKQHTDYPLIRSHAQRLYNMHTTYRNLLPKTKSYPASQQWSHFLIRPLNASSSASPRFVVPEQHVDDVLKMLPEAGFIDISDSDRHTPVEYKLPERFSDSYLRVSVDAEKGVYPTIMIRFDNQAPMTFRIRTEPKLPEDAYDISAGEKALSFLNKSKGETWNNAERVRLISSLLPDVGFFEIRLPRKVRTIQMWIPNMNGGKPSSTIKAALQYRVATYFRLSENEHLWMIRQVEEELLYRSFLSYVKNYPESDARIITDKKEFYQTELFNHWQPLIRLLYSRAKIFKSNIQPCETNENQKPQPDFEDTARKAIQLEKNNQWPTALETWSDIFHTAHGGKKEDARFAVIRCLQHLGEDYLAEQMLKEHFWYPYDCTSHNRSFKELASIYTGEENSDQLISLYASEISFDPSPDLLSRLCIALIAEGYHQEGLMLGYIIPESHRPVSQLLGAANRLRAWQTFDNLLTRLKEKNEKYFWQGLKAVNQGDVKKARSDWEMAGRTMSAVDYEKTLTKGMDILTGINAESPDTRVQAIIAWEDWQRSHPGPYVWEKADHMVKDYAGTHLLYTISRDLFFQTFKATPQTPVTLNTAGPAKIRIIVRPLHAPESVRPVTGWITITNNDELYVVPVNRNLPTSGLSVAEDDTLQVGGSVSYELDIPAGIHDIKIKADHFPILVQVMIQQPANTLNILPLLTPDTIKAALNGKLKYSQSKNPLNLIRNVCASKMTIIPQNPDTSPRTRRLPKPHYPIESEISHNDTSAPYISILNRIRPEVAISTTRQHAKMLANNQIDPIIDSCSTHNKETICHFMTLLIWIAEHHPEKAEHAIIEGEKMYLAYQNMHIPQLRSLYNRLTQNRKWVPVKSVQAGAGWRYSDIQGWQPESSYMRIRKALIGPIKPYEHILFDDQSLVLSTRFFEPTSVEIELRKAEIACLSDFPMTANIQVDENPPQSVVLLKDREIQSVHTVIPAGEHFLKLRITQKYENQFLRCTFYEIIKPTFKKDIIRRPITSNEKRAYLVTTKSEPIEIEMQGPAWLRIDEYKSNTTNSRYQEIPQGWQQVRVLPPYGQDEALVRIFQQRPDTVTYKPEVRAPDIAPIPVPPSLFTVDTFGQPMKKNISDGFSLGGQEDGTWSLEAGLKLNNTLLEDDTEEEDQYLELGIMHRYYQSHTHTYTHAHLLERSRKDGSASSGFICSLTRYPVYFPLNVTIDGEIYCQDIESTTEWSALVKGSVFRQYEILPKIHHKPLFLIFKRALSGDDVMLEPTENIDQDVFSTYKYTHQSGFQITETLLYRPWLDMLWFFTGGITSNDADNFFQMDHFLFKAGWKQLFGNIVLRADTKYRYYVNDEDRDEIYHRFALGMGFVWEKWFPNQHRVEFQGDVSHNINDSATSAMVTVTYHFGKGRAYRDFQAGEIDFINLRKQQVPHGINNVINVTDHE